MATYTVYVYGIFTRDALSGENGKRCRTRLNQDIRTANQTWKVGGTDIINFVSGGTFFSPLLLNATSLTSSETMSKGGAVDSLIQQTKRHTNHRMAIYVVYLSGDFFAGGRQTVGVALPDFEDFRNESDFKLFGHIALSDRAADTYTLAHEVGHILFTRFHSAQNQFISDDPSGPYIHPQTGRKDPSHNNERNNIMYPAIPSVHPLITSQQCHRARQSKVVFVRD
ncbi:hypothetical protein ACFFIX_23810 [Metabacillus herbersteinensis]|uniref:ImmA/IrrE family metallo-endopeptidase n=1 Tax=Metabacillus herbersteinensis TaxID=283816 RepID=A0ABV6GND2_9BACI